jgi:protein-S-isoprenylcysteine O-methyltransferase Ste14
MRSRAVSLIGSGLFLVAAPGTVAGLIPWLISRWRFAGEPGATQLLPIAGIIALLAGAAILLDSFVRFAWTGLGTPAPIAPTDRLIVSGLYRHVRNPMYVAVLLLIFGQALLFGSAALCVYGAAMWLVFHLFVTGYEEPTLRQQFPDDYDGFVRGVPRWLPRLTPWRRQDAA